MSKDQNKTEDEDKRGLLVNLACKPNNIWRLDRSNDSQTQLFMPSSSATGTELDLGHGVGVLLAVTLWFNIFCNHADLGIALDVVAGARFCSRFCAYALKYLQQAAATSDLH